MTDDPREQEHTNATGKGRMEGKGRFREPRKTRDPTLGANKMANKMAARDCYLYKLPYIRGSRKAKILDKKTRQKRCQKSA